jgi:AraC-like DNA-binding protein
LKVRLLPGVLIFRAYKNKLASMLTYKEYKPSQRLQNIIRCYYLYENTHEPSSVTPELVSPDGTFEINFRLNFPGQGMNTYLIALFTEPVVHNPAEMGKILGISFQPWAIFSLLKIPCGELIDRKIDAVQLFGRSIGVLYDRILREESVDKAISLIEEYFDGLYTERDFIIEDISRKIIKSCGILKMDRLYSSYNVSGRRIEQRFLEAIGITPKYFSRLMKYRSALSRMRKSSCNINLTSIAYECGYYDQSHFIREFNVFAGVAPTKYLSSKHTIDDLNLNSLYS